MRVSFSLYLIRMSLKRKATKAILFAAALSITPAIGFAVEVAPFTIVSARANAMGGLHAALADDFSALFSNPAGFVSARQELSFAELTVSAYGPLFDILESALSMSGGTEDLDLSGIVGPRGLKTGLELSGPLSFGWVGRGLGFGFFNRTDIGASAQGMTIGAEASEDLFLVGGYAFRFSPRNGHDIDLGFSAKGFLRGTIAAESSILTVTDLLDDDLLSARPFSSTAGVGVDLGVRYEYAKTIAASVVCRDAYSPALVTTYASINDFTERSGSPESEYGQILPRLDIGLLYAPRFELIERYISGLLIAADYRDIMDLLTLIPRNPILNISLGVELTLLEVLSLRAGIADALPSAGFGLDLSFMQLDFAMRGIEFGLDPGFDPIFAMDLGLTFRY